MNNPKKELVPLVCVDPKKGFVKYYESDEVVMIPKEYEQPEIELRGSWIATLNHIDLPACITKEQYQEAYIKTLDEMVEYNMNAVYVQLRPMNDAFYKSKYNPYSRFLCESDNGYIEGKDPGWDVVQFFIDEAHKRNLQFHAWLNPYRVSVTKPLLTKDLTDEELVALKEKDLGVLHPTNFARMHPETLIMSVDGQLIFDPTLPEVQKHLVDTMEELMDMYPIDGFHFDDYFYPWNGLDPRMDDKESYKKHGNGMDLGDFRRHGITTLMRKLKKLADVRNAKGRNLLFGISPFAIYKNKSSDLEGSNTLGSQAYSMWYADLKLWVEEELLHYIMPQIYWEFEHPVAKHADVMDWWSNLMKGSNVHLHLGVALSRFERSPETIDRTTVPNMIKYAQKAGVNNGFVVWHNRMLYSDYHPELIESQKILKKMWNKPVKLPTYTL